MCIYLINKCLWQSRTGVGANRSHRTVGGKGFHSWFFVCFCLFVSSYNLHTTKSTDLKCLVWCVLASVNTHVATSQLRNSMFPFSNRVPSGLVQSIPSPRGSCNPISRQPLINFSYYDLSLTALELYINGIIYYVIFCGWLLLLNLSFDFEIYPCWV